MYLTSLLPKKNPTFKSYLKYTMPIDKISMIHDKKYKTIWSLNITKTTKTLFYLQWLHHNTNKNIVQCFPYLLLLSHCFWNNSCSIHLQSILPKAIFLFDGLVAKGEPLFCRVRTSNCSRLSQVRFITRLRFCGDRLPVCLSAFLEIGVLL